MAATIDPTAEINEKERSKKVEGLWNRLLETREAAQPALSPLDQKISPLKEAIPKDLFDENQTWTREITNLSPTDPMLTETGEKNDPLKKKHINLQRHNIKLAAQFDNIYGQKIRNKGQDLKNLLDLQKNLLDLKAMLPKDLSSGKKIGLPEKTTKLIDLLNAKHKLNLDPSDIPELRVQAESELDRLKLEVQHGFSDVQTLNHERMLIWNLASRQRDERDRMVQNQIPH